MVWHNLVALRLDSYYGRGSGSHAGPLPTDVLSPLTEDDCVDRSVSLPSETNLIRSLSIIGICNGPDGWEGIVNMFKTAMKPPGMPVGTIRISDHFRAGSSLTFISLGSPKPRLALVHGSVAQTLDGSSPYRALPSSGLVWCEKRFPTKLRM